MVKVLALLFLQFRPSEQRVMWVYCNVAVNPNMRSDCTMSIRDKYIMEGIFKERLCTKLNQLHTHPNLKKILSTFVGSWLQDKAMITTDLDTELCKAQEDIGWTQIISGHTVQCWTDHQYSCLRKI
eukprot:2204412-Ditylum_brightwellii.AAC.2